LFYQFTERKYYSGEETQEKDISGEHGKWGGGRETVQGFDGKILRNETIWKDACVDRKINLKWPLNRMGECGLD